MRDYAAEAETQPATVAPQTIDIEPPQAFVADMVLKTFRTRLIGRLALVTQVFLTLAAGFGLIIAVWALTT